MTLDLAALELMRWRIDARTPQASAAAEAVTRRYYDDFGNHLTPAHQSPRDRGSGGEAK